MADFCKQCAEELYFGTGDLAGLITEEEVKQGLGAVVLCEGCSIAGSLMTRVNHLGECIDSRCIKHGALPKDEDES